jgi:alkylated DNA repair dioxygenase AlkB
MLGSPGLFGSSPAQPPGLRYVSDLLSSGEERSLVERIERLEFRPFEFHGFTGNRRIVSFGWRYDFAHARLDPADEFPPFLIDLRRAVAAFAGVDAEAFRQALVTEYAPEAGIGWHRDRPMFGAVVGVSLVHACTFRLRRKVGTRWRRAALVLEPRSAYLLSGAVRDEWEHSIPPVDALRYSVTFRTFREGAAPGAEERA